MLSEEEKKAIEYYSNKEVSFEVSFEVNFDIKNLLKDLGITEEDSFENQQIRIKTLLNLVNKLQKETEEKNKQIDLMAEHIVSSAIVDDTVCAIKCDCESDILEDCSHEKMLNCTKQYFKRKATNIG